MLVDISETHKVEIETPSCWMEEHPEINVTSYLYAKSSQDIDIITFANRTIRFVNRLTPHNINWGNYKPIEKDIYDQALARFKKESLCIEA